MNTALTVFLKEVRENLRDKRTLMSALIYGPLLGPVLFGVMMNVMINRQLDRAEQPLKVPVIGTAYAPNLVAALKQQGLVPEPAPADPVRAVQQQDADVVLRIPPAYAGAWNAGEQAQVELIFDSSQRDADTAVERLDGMLKSYARQQGAMRLMARGLSPALATPLTVARRDQATAQSRTALMFAFLPYFFVLAVFLGGMYLAIDLSAGERERQSLEPLFANPVARWRILVGKLGAICAFSVASLLLCVIAFAAVGHFIPLDRLGMRLDLGVAFAGKVLLLELPLVFLLAVLQTLVASFAKSYREAQTYLQILMMLPILPSIGLMLLPVKAAGWMYAVPLLAQQVGIVQLLRGAPPTAMQIATCVLTGSAVALLAGLVTAHVYRSERLAISA